MATTTKHNIYIYIRVVTKYFYCNYSTTVFHPDPTTVPPLGMQNPILLSNNILRLRILISICLYYEIITINTLNFSLRTLFSSIQLLQSQYTLLTSTNYPVTTHLSQVTLYNPVTQLYKR